MKGGNTKGPGCLGHQLFSGLWRFFSLSFSQLQMLMGPLLGPPHEPLFFPDQDRRVMVRERMCNGAVLGGSTEKKKKKRKETGGAVMSWSWCPRLFKNAQASSQGWWPLLGGRVMPGLFLVKCLGSVSPGVLEWKSNHQTEEAHSACLLDYSELGKGRRWRPRPRHHGITSAPCLLPPQIMIALCGSLSLWWGKWDVVSITREKYTKS